MAFLIESQENIKIHNFVCSGMYLISSRSFAVRSSLITVYERAVFDVKAEPKNDPKMNICVVSLHISVSVLLLFSMIGSVA